nr:retrovirus-related Pol polyprotein from transposon TNT 1-94 [Tanacetum cinerariifolium]
LNVNSDLKCATCNGCLFSDNHDSCVLEFINSVNARVKSKSAKKLVNRKIWKPTRKLFTTIGHKCRPTGRTFTLVGNVCPLTRITTTAIMPLRKHIPLESNKSKPVGTLVYSQKPKEVRNKVPVNNSKINKSLYLDSGCSKHITEDRSQLINFVQKFLGTIKFGNDHVAKIMSYGDYKIGNVTISKDEALDFIIKFLKMIQVRLKVPVRRIRTDNETEFVNQSLREYYEQVGISHETSVARSPQQNSVVERRNRTLIEAARTIRTRRIVETIHVDFDELTAMASEQISSRPALNEMTHAIISSGLVPKPSSSTPYVPPSRNGWDLQFQLLFDELLTPSPIVDPPAHEVIALTADVILPVQVDLTDVEEDIHDIEVAHMGNDLLFGMPIPEVASDQSSLTVSSHTIVQPDHLIPQHNSKWTKDQPLDNIIGQLSRPISTRLQLHEQALFCYYDAFLTLVEPKTYKDALTQSCWIEAMQEELNEFERLEKYGFESCDPMDTLMVKKSKLDEDKERKAFDPSHYRAFADADHAGCQDTRLAHLVENGVIKLYFVNTEYQLADLFAKALGRDRIEFLINKLGMRSFTPETLKQFTDEVDE